jgi:hypothetical protein
MASFAKFNDIDDVNFIAEINSKKMEHITLFQESRKSLDGAFAFACYWGHYDVARWLLAVKPDIKADFNYLFQISCEQGYIILAKFLLEKRSSEINISNIDNYAYKRAYINNHTDICDWLKSLKPELENLDKKIDDEIKA